MKDRNFNCRKKGNEAMSNGVCKTRPWAGRIIKTDSEIRCVVDTG